MYTYWELLADDEDFSSSTNKHFSQSHARIANLYIFIIKILTILNRNHLTQIIL